MVIQWLALTGRYANSLRVQSTFHAGMGQQCFGWSHKKRVDACFLEREGVITFVQYHDRGSHQAKGPGGGRHQKSCPRWRPLDEPFKYLEETEMSDRLNRAYARAMTEGLQKHGYKITISYKVFSECEFFHGAVLDGTTETDLHKALSMYFPQQSLLKPKWLCDHQITIAEIWRRMISSTDLDGSFVVIKQGAYESKDDVISHLFGFCLQRDRPNPEDLGPFARKLAEKIIRAKLSRISGESEKGFIDRLNAQVTKYLAMRCEGPFTSLRKSFSVGDVCLSVQNLKWLIKYRNLKDVHIIHLIYYEERLWLTEFMRTCLQARHDLIAKGEKNSLRSSVLKIIANAYYGKLLLENSRYHSYTYTTGKSLLKNKRRINALDLTLMGAEKRNGKVDLIYMMRHSRENARIENSIQVGASILSNSRDIFYTHIYNLLDVLDPAKAEFSYCDTDSLFFLVAHENIRACVAADKLEHYDRIASSIFENVHSKTTNAGLFKVEGYFEIAKCRSVKNYIMIPFKESAAERVVKSKGLPRHIRDNMGVRHFSVYDHEEQQQQQQGGGGGCSASGSASGSARGLSEKEKLDRIDILNPKHTFFQTFSLFPTMSESVVIGLKRRKMANSINCKRIMLEVGNLCATTDTANYLCFCRVRLNTLCRFPKGAASGAGKMVFKQTEKRNLDFGFGN